MTPWERKLGMSFRDIYPIYTEVKHVKRNWRNFFEIHHHNTAEGKYWNPALDSFTAENWREKVREIAALKMEYIVVMATALYDRCYFESSVFPLADIPCADPIEAVLDEADKCGIKVFLGNGFYGDWTKPEST